VVTGMDDALEAMDDALDDIGFDDTLVGYAVDRFGQAAPAQVVGSLLREADLERLSEVIDAYGLEAVAEQYLRALIADGTLHVDEAAANEERERLLDEEAAFGVPKVHAVSVADLADELTRIGIVEPPPSCHG